MSNSVYKVNRAINKAIEFKGLKAQYIWWLGGGLLTLLILFAVLYIAGVNSYICLALVVGLTILLFMRVSVLSHKYGQYGMMKNVAAHRIPKTVRVRTRKVFYQFPLQKRR